MTSSASYAAAEAIKARVLNELQNADELGGPDWREYVSLMEELRDECADRARVAMETNGPRAVLRHYQARLTGRIVGEAHTGGGCTAIEISADNGRTWLVTSADGGCAPDDLHEPVCLGKYEDDGICLACFEFDDSAAAINVILAEVIA